MKDSIIIGLLQNTAILLAFAMLYDNIWIKNESSKSILAKIFIGFFLSGIGVVLMFSPWTWVPGIVFDTRSVMISISGLFFGAIPTIILMAITSIVRLLIGGDGQWMGIAVIISSGTIGLLWREFRPNWKDKKYYLELLAMGFIVHITMSACTIFLPSERIISTLKIIAIPIIFIYSPVTMILGIIMLRQYNNWQNRLAQLKLKESERRFSQILESGNIVSLLLNKDGSINFCNDYLLQITGYSRNEILGKNWFDLFVPNDVKEGLFQVFAENIQTKNILNNYENQILSKNGEILYISWYNITLQSDSDEMLGLASIGVNITSSKTYEYKLKEKNEEIEAQNEEYKQLNEELIRAKEKAEESDRLKSAFLANMSHEIRTPMNGILGFAEILKQPNLTGEEQQKYIKIIEKSDGRMLNIINDIVDISKIESGLMEVNINKIKINELIEYVYTFFKPEVESKGIKLFIKNQLPLKEIIINTDREKIYAILINLVKNAIKYTNEGIIEFGYETNDKTINFFVKDTGIGVPKDRKAAIFERFIQADISDEMARQGAGLGLSISKAYVEMLGGKIWVESEEGNGSTFCFTIPYSTESLNKIIIGNNIITNEVLTQIKPLKILIAEDDEASAMLIAFVLKKFCKTILEAKTGFEAIEICRNNPDLDLILMDVRMPEVSGYDATQQIRQFNKDVIIIAQTAYGLIGDREKLIAAGCNDYISKPINIPLLKELMGKYFNKTT